MRHVTPSLIVHGGAGTLDAGTEQVHIEGMRRAAEVGWRLLLEGCPALDAVEQAVRVLEDDPEFDAGRGSYPNAAGHIEMDALIMDGRTLESGAVAAMQCIAHPITLARLVMSETPHSLLVGEGAQAFAEQMGIPRVPEEELLVERELRRWQEWRRTQDAALLKPTRQAGHGTVGAVARDCGGNLAAATSTGGTRHKLAGRVGDTPLVGCGGYADNLTAAASATGLGESLMKIVICKTACDLVGKGLEAQAAADEVIRLLSSPRIKGQGGLIIVDREGHIGFAYNTTHMARAYVLPDGSICAKV